MFEWLGFPRIAIKKLYSLKTPHKTLTFNATKKSWNNFETTFALLKITKILNICANRLFFLVLQLKILNFTKSAPKRLKWSCSKMAGHTWHLSLINQYMYRPISKLIKGMVHYQSFKDGLPAIKQEKRLWYQHGFIMLLCKYWPWWPGDNPVTFITIWTHPVSIQVYIDLIIKIPRLLVIRGMY